MLFVYIQILYIPQVDPIRPKIYQAFRLYHMARFGQSMSALALALSFSRYFPCIFGIPTPSFAANLACR